MTCYGMTWHDMTWHFHKNGHFLQECAKNPNKIFLNGNCVIGTINWDVSEPCHTLTWHDMTCHVISMKMVVFYGKIYFFTWFLERIANKLSYCYIDWCHSMVSHDMSWHGMMQHDKKWSCSAYSLLFSLRSLLQLRLVKRQQQKRTENLTLKILLMVFDLLTLRQIHLCKSKPFLIA